MKAFQFRSDNIAARQEDYEIDIERWNERWQQNEEEENEIKCCLNFLHEEEKR